MGLGRQLDSTGGPSLTHTYGAEDSYLITLTVADVQGQTSFTSQWVDVTITPPTGSGNFAATATSTTTVALSWTA